MPPQPASAPSSSDTGLNQPQLANIPAATEQQKQIARSVARGRKIRAATSTVIQTRGQLVSYLRQNGLDLLTSSLEFQQTGDFITSSYVVYPSHGNLKEPLVEFLRRYPSLQEPILAIRDSLRPLQDQMQVRTPNPLDLM